MSLFAMMLIIYGRAKPQPVSWNWPYK